jgi:predicted ATPase
MLRSLRLQNYRCFADHTVPFSPVTVVVGKNNAGKSTIVEALNLVAAAVNRKSANFTLPPKQLDLPRFRRGFTPSISHLDINLRTIFHRYGAAPAMVTATFEGNVTVKVFVHEEGAFATIDNKGEEIRSAGALTGAGLPGIHVLPQIGPLQTEETYLTDDYVSSNFYTRLSSRHFRNQMYRNPDNFNAFKELAESTWHGLRIAKVERSRDDLSLFVTDGDFAAEVGWMGHGLQMWLQTMWFIAKTDHSSVIVLDEPDVYMHPDLQRRLYRLARARFAQSIIATHSVEIMAESDPENILIVNSKERRSKYANSEPAVQLIIDRLGGIHNVHLARLWNAKRVLLLEGKDLAFLKVFHSIAYPDSESPLDAIPNLSIGGWGGWDYAIGSKMALKNAVGDDIAAYCILDGDYHSQVEKQERLDKAKQQGISLHIWKRKEIENYLLEPEVIARVIKRRSKCGAPTAEDVKNMLVQACDGERDTVLDGIASAQDRKLGAGGANKLAREFLSQHWGERRLALVSGKTLLSKLNDWAQEKFETSVGAVTIAKAFRPTEIPTEMLRVLEALEEVAPFLDRN